MAKPSPFSTQSRLSETFRINGCLDTEKFVSLTASDSDVQTFLGGEENQNTERKTKATYSVALVLAFLAAGSENRELEDLLLADFARVPKRFLLSVRTI